MPSSPSFSSVLLLFSFSPKLLAFMVSLAHTVKILAASVCGEQSSRCRFHSVLLHVRLFLLNAGLIIALVIVTRKVEGLCTTYKS